MKWYIDWHEKPVTFSYLVPCQLTGLSLSLSRTLAFIRDLEILRRRRLIYWTSIILAGKCDSRHSTTSFRENVAVAEASYQMLENLSFWSLNSLGPKKCNEAFRGQISYSQSFSSSKVSIMLPWMWNYGSLRRPFYHLSVSINQLDSHHHCHLKSRFLLQIV